LRAALGLCAEKIVAEALSLLAGPSKGGLAA
jgi:hypothetical protein